MLIVLKNQFYYAFAKSRVECNICHYKADKLASDTWHKNAHCPSCGSGVRHRLIFATFQHLNDFSFKKLIDGKKVLHFAPEKSVSEILKHHSQEYKTADYFAEGYSYKNIDFNLDISKMPTIADDSFDCAIACDVLEHVTNDINGIKEVYRILKKGGYCIFTVPQRDHLKITYEDVSITKPADREKAYGQVDHLRIYGDDFSSIMENCGFKVTEINETNFSKEVVDRNVLFPPVLSKNINATNYRKVFIGLK